MKFKAQQVTELVQALRRDPRSEAAEKLAQYSVDVAYRMAVVQNGGVEVLFKVLRTGNKEVRIPLTGASVSIPQVPFCLLVLCNLAPAVDRWFMDKRSQ